MTAFDEDLAQLLHDLGLGVYDPTGTASPTIFLGELPAEPARALAVVLVPGGTSDARIGHDQPRARIVCRAPLDRRDAGRDAQAVYDALNGLTRRNLTSGAHLVLCTSPGVIALVSEETDRHRYAVPLTAHLHRATVHRY